MAKEILSAQHAKDELEKNERLEGKIKKLIMPSLISSILFVVGFTGFNQIEIGFLRNYVFGLMFVIALLANIILFVASIVLGGKAMLQLISSIIFIGFILLPLPFNIFVGFFVLVYAVLCGLSIPVVFFAIALIKIKRENKKYSEYLQYCPEGAE